MNVLLHCAPVDVSARSLGLLIDGPLPDVLAEHTLANSRGGRVRLGIIGASHVASVYDADTLLFREEVSCNVPGPLPPQINNPQYSFTQRIERLSDAEIAHRASLLDDDSWLVARFPGVGPHHFTAVSGRWERGAWEWRTLHCYPMEHTMVTTQSRYQP